MLQWICQSLRGRSLWGPILILLAGLGGGVAICFFGLRAPQATLSVEIASAYRSYAFTEPVGENTGFLSRAPLVRIHPAEFRRYRLPVLDTGPGEFLFAPHVEFAPVAIRRARLETPRGQILEELRPEQFTPFRQIALLEARGEELHLNGEDGPAHPVLRVQLEGDYLERALLPPGRLLAVVGLLAGSALLAWGWYRLPLGRWLAGTGQRFGAPILSLLVHPRTRRWGPSVLLAGWVLLVVLGGGLPAWKNAWKHPGAPLWLKVEARSLVDSVMKVYYRGNEGFRESQSIRQPVQADRNWEVLRFGLPGRPIKELRLDPLEREGVVEIRRLWLETRGGHIEEDLPLALLQTGTEIAELIMEDNVLRITTVRGAVDPTLLLELKSPLLRERSFVIRWAIPLGQILLLGGLALAAAGAARGQWKNQLATNRKSRIFQCLRPLLLSGLAGFLILGSLHARAGFSAELDHFQLDQRGIQFVGGAAGWTYFLLGIVGYGLWKRISRRRCIDSENPDTPIEPVEYQTSSAGLSSNNRWTDPVNLLWLLGLPFGLAFCLTTPPFQSPDEFIHFHRSYHVSMGHLHPDARENMAVGELPTVLREFGNPWHYLPLFPERHADGTTLRRGFGLWDDGERETFDLTQSNHVAVLAYLPQATGIALARWSGLSVGGQFYAGRLANLLATLLLLHLALRVWPSMRNTMLVIMLVPTGLFLYATLSYDAITNALAFLYVGLIFRWWQDPDAERNALKWGLGLGALLIALFTIKFSYFLMGGLLALLTVGRNRGIRKASIAMATAVAVFGLGALFWVLGLIGAPKDSWGKEIDGTLQLQFILSQPMEFLGILVETIRLEYLRNLSDMIGLMGWIDTPLHPLALFAWIMAAVVAFRMDCQRIHLMPNAMERVFLLGLSGLTVILIYTLFFFNWTFPGEATIAGFQGRYLIPLLPLVAWALLYRPHDHGEKTTWSRGMVLAGLVTALVWTWLALWMRFWIR